MLMETKKKLKLKTNKDYSFAICATHVCKTASNKLNHDISYIYTMLENSYFTENTEPTK